MPLELATGCPHNCTSLAIIAAPLAINFSVVKWPHTVHHHVRIANTTIIKGLFPGVGWDLIDQCATIVADCASMLCLTGSEY